jgi:hypothetical protein
MHHQKYFKKGIYKLLKQVDQIFTFWTLYLQDWLKASHNSDAFYLSKFLMKYRWLSFPLKLFFECENPWIMFSHFFVLYEHHFKTSIPNY